jgi:3-hydroxyacyl-CoA dehydrogenase
MTGPNGNDARATVAVIGAGIMGSAIARNLVAAGLTTRVWDGHHRLPLRLLMRVPWSRRRRGMRCGTRAW